MSADRFRGFFRPIIPAATDAHPNPNSNEDLALSHSKDDEIFLGYLSDESEDDLWESEDEMGDHEIVKSVEPMLDRPPKYSALIPAPKLKRRKLLVPARISRAKEREGKRKEREKTHQSALDDIRKLIRAKKTQFNAGPTGLQSYRARSIESCLHLVVNDCRTRMEASQIAAQAQGFAKPWGGRLVRKWVAHWITHRNLPTSMMGRHKKTYSLLTDPVICAELRSFMRTNKWKMDPKKVAEYSREKMVTAEMKTYLDHVNNIEMPKGLKKYLEIELFPRIQYKAAYGVSLATARRWLRAEGFEWKLHAKGLFYDGHERNDIVHDRQMRFLPAMAEYAKRLIRYEVGNTDKPCLPLNFVERPLVLLCHDEMTAQAQDGVKASWVLEGEQPIRKKGAGRGIHQSDVISSTVGWLSEASVTLEYGKNHDGFWNGSMFVEQLKNKIIPAFERAHGPGYQALVMVDHSQGHEAYPDDALRVSEMNFRSGGRRSKQVPMRPGWFIKDGIQYEQPMNFPSDHPHASLRNQPKGIAQVLTERGLWREKLRFRCGNSKNSPQKCTPTATDCCAYRILSLQPDFQAQRSSVEETIEQAGHLCIFLPKYHCELNTIEFFWGAVKRYLREHCDYTFNTLRDNMPIALRSVSINLIRKWEHRMIRWMEAYRSGLDAKSAQLQVKAFSSRKYKSHRRVGETVASTFDHQPTD